MIRIEIPERRGAELVSKIAERDQYAQSAQQVLDAKNQVIEAMIIGQLQAAGKDPDAPRGQVQCQKERDGKYWLTVQDAQQGAMGQMIAGDGMSLPQSSIPPNGSAN